MKYRCSWCKNHPLSIKYHDMEWGVPQKNEQKLFEYLTLEGGQAGLNWLTILKKRDNYYQAFDKFNIQKIAKYSDSKITKLMNNSGIIRNKLKILSTISNAKSFLDIQQEFGSFYQYQSQFIDNSPIVNKWKSIDQIPNSTHISDAFSKDLKKRGFKFVGTTIMYAYMQAAGMVNDHIVSCFRYKEVM
ncbi:MAG: DNA-3-methyladenine glycosylase I [Legionellales bacterium]|nr:DNA-3-methyladenine glycosylase I [Legionellales bacterium]